MSISQMFLEEERNRRRRRLFPETLRGDQPPKIASTWQKFVVRKYRHNHDERHPARALGAVGPETAAFVATALLRSRNSRSLGTSEGCAQRPAGSLNG
jgi:hypothetical protein